MSVPVLRVTTSFAVPVLMVPPLVEAVTVMMLSAAVAPAMFSKPL
jgi:hypothetical protein